MLSYLSHIIVEELKYQERNFIVGREIDGLYQFPTNGRQLKIQKIGMSTLQVIHQSRNRQSCYMILHAIVLFGQKVYDNQKSSTIYSIHAAYFLYGLVAEAQWYAKTAQDL